MGTSTLPQALTDKVIVQLVKEEVSKGGIHIPPTKHSEAEFGVVVAEGPQVYPTELVGQTVVVNPYNGDRFKFHDVDYLVFSLKDILAVV